MFNLPEPYEPRTKYERDYFDYDDDDEEDGEDE